VASPVIPRLARRNGFHRMSLGHALGKGTLSRKETTKYNNCYCFERSLADCGHVAEKSGTTSNDCESCDQRDACLSPTAAVATTMEGSRSLPSRPSAPLTLSTACERVSQSSGCCTHPIIMFLLDWWYSALASLGELPVTLVRGMSRSLLLVWFLLACIHDRPTLGSTALVISRSHG
jgi:hypothetical protein